MIADAAITASGSLIELARRSWIVLFFNVSDDKGICSSSVKRSRTDFSSPAVNPEKESNSISVMIDTL